MFCRLWEPRVAAHAVPLVLFHDSLGSIGMWRGFPALLAEALGRPVIAYDRLGFGRSSARTELPAARFILEEAEIYFPVIAEALGLRRVVLLGHSVGGCMAVACAGRFPQNCDGLITVSAQAFVEDRTREGVRIARAQFAATRKFAKLVRYHGDKANWVLRAWTDIWLSDEFESWTLAPELRKVRCPLLAIHGDRDEYGSTAFADAICELAGGPAQKLILPDCGHLPHRDQPQTLVDAVRRFLGSQDATAAGQP